jgi:CubicO group peptidase (beta-lactamase class C family)
MKKLLSVLIAVLLIGCAGAPQRPAELPRGDMRYLESYMDWYFARNMSKYGVPGVSVALVSDNKILWMKGYGYADVERTIPATTRSVYQVGSISKTFTAAAVMQQVERGTLDLDAPIQKYLPDFTMKSRWGAPRPSLRELLSHHAGLPTYYLKGFFSHQPLNELIDALKDEHLAYQPRQIFNYSNLGPDIAGAALERLSGADFAAHMQKALLDPLGMVSSSFALDERVRPVFARGYIKGTPSEAVTIRDVPAGGLFSNVEDMARFMRMMLSRGTLDGRRILSGNSIDAMLTPQFADLPYNFGQRFGLGLMLSGIPIHNAGTVAWHNGGTKTFISQMALLPDKKLGVIVLANADRAGPMVYEAAEEVLRLALEARENITQPPAPARVAPQIDLAEAELDRYTGDYSLMGALARIERSGKRLRFHVLGHTLELVPVTHRNFRVEYRVLGLFAVPIPFAPIEFTEVEKRMVMLMRDRGVAITAEKVPSYEVSDAWRRRTGNYRLMNPDKEYLVDVEHARLTVEDNKILMNIRISGLEDREVKVVMMPLSDDSAYTFGIGRNVGDVTVVERHEGRERMRYLGYYFEREESIASKH